MKDHKIAELVNTLTEIAKQHHDKQCLRELLSAQVVRAVRGLVASEAHRRLWEIISETNQTMPLEKHDSLIAKAKRLVNYGRE